MIVAKVSSISNISIEIVVFLWIGLLRCLNCETSEIIKLTQITKYLTRYLIIKIMEQTFALWIL